jgi:hypothetical protein
MSLTNSGQGTLTGTQTGVSNALALNFGFKLHNSNSFNLNISLTTTFQSPDAVGQTNTAVPTGWVNNGTAKLIVNYPTFWIAKDQTETAISSGDIVTGSYTDNSSNFYSVTSVTNTALCSGFSNDLFSRGSSMNHLSSFEINPCNISRTVFYAYSQLNQGYIAANNKTPTFYVQLGSGGWNLLGSVELVGPINIVASPQPTDGGGSAPYYYFKFPLSSGSSITYIQVIWT